MHSRWFQIIPEKVLSPQVTSHVVFFLVVFGCDSKIDFCRYIWSKRTWFPANYPINQTLKPTISGWRFGTCFLHILGISSSQLTNSIIFQRGWYTINQRWNPHFWWSNLHFDRTSWLNPHATRSFFPECVARVPVHSGGLGVEGVFARRCVCGRNRSQPFATVRVRTVWPCLW